MSATRALWGVRRLAAIYRRELLSYFVSPIAYIILFAFLLVNGVTFYFYLQVSGGNLDLLLNSQYGSVTFWFLALL